MSCYHIAEGADQPCMRAPLPLSTDHVQALHPSAHVRACSGSQKGRHPAVRGLLDLFPSVTNSRHSGIPESWKSCPAHKWPVPCSIPALPSDWPTACVSSCQVTLNGRSAESEKFNVISTPQQQTKPQKRPCAHLPASHWFSHLHEEPSGGNTGEEGVQGRGSLGGDEKH